MSGPAAASIFDRLLLRLVPQPVADVAPPPRALVDGVFVLDRELRHFGVARLPARTTLLRLDDGRLLLVSPPPGLDAPTTEAIEALGPVGFVLVPNPFHHLYVEACRRRFPEAVLLGPPGLAARLPALACVREIGPEASPGFGASVDHAVVGPPTGPAEVALFHRPSGTLVLTDLAFHMRRYRRGFDRVLWRLSGLPAGFGPGRTTRRLLLADAAAARPGLARIAGWPIERIVVAHGDVVEGDAAARFRAAFATLLEARG